MDYLAKSGTWKIAAAAGVVVIGFMLTASKKKPKPMDTTSTKKVIGDTTVIRLLHFEITEINRVPALNTVTFFKGKVSVDSVRSKVHSIIKANPWLLGKVILSKDFGQMALSYPTEYTPDLVGDRFQVVSNPQLRRDMKHDEMSDQCKKYFLSPAENCIDKDDPVFRVVLFEIKPDEEYALLLSMSHIVADGYTYYTIYSMLDLDTPVRSMIVERIHDFEALSRHALTDELMDWMRKQYLLVGLILTILFGKKPVASAYSVSEEVINQIKSDHIHKNVSLQDSKKDGDVKEYGRVPFLSTNDILTSWFFRTCKDNVCIMPMNFRNRLKGITSDHAGNYEKCQIYNTADGWDPRYVRQSVTADKEGVFRTKSLGRLPTLWDCLRGNLALVTNWSTFYKDIRITAAPLKSPEDVFHRPVNRPEDMAFSDVCIIFKSNQNTTVVNCNCRSVNMQQLVASGDEAVKILEKRLF